ncbi:MAG: hypothetical protein JO319_02910 [Acidobacteriaceae bacterium]|nr:hypothetical protein [Acidobacteriaceae bacterium]
MPPPSAVGFAPADWLLALLTVLLIGSALAWRPAVRRALESFASRTRVCVILLFALPIFMRLLLLPNHPVPRPQIYDEFSHLLLADTLLHARLANSAHPLHQFFETFFVLQEPTYSSIYPLGQGLVLAFGRLVSGVPWTGVLLIDGALCAACYWMLRGFVAPGWALLGGAFAVMAFGPLSQWINSYWGGSMAATGGALVFGCLPRLKLYGRSGHAILLGIGFGMHMLARQFESVLLLACILLFVLLEFRPHNLRRRVFRPAVIALCALAPFGVLILLQNKAVTHSWVTLPEQLSQYQYGVPTSLTIEQTPVPHVALTPQQELDYQAQSLMHGSGTDTLSKFLLRLEYRVRYYRFFFLPPLYIALIAFCFTLRTKRNLWVAASLLLFALGTNLFPYLLVHYLAAVTCLFVLVSIIGLEQLSRLHIRGSSAGAEIVIVLVALCFAEFSSWYILHLFETPSSSSILQYETWDSINHRNPERRERVAAELSAIPGQLLVFVRYTPHHVYQDEWVWNGADIDASRVVYARDLGPGENEKLIGYYPRRRVFLLEPDVSPVRLSPYNAHS